MGQSYLVSLQSILGVSCLGRNGARWGTEIFDCVSMLEIFSFKPENILD